jgi:2-polyprenyl-6-methoxyphenol hydroxylase-like FAD-dependent oxidoreductase
MKLGNRAIVAGAGMGGLAAAAALAPHFTEVLVIDRDTLPDDIAPRLGVGQGAHTHQLLKAGELALEKLLPCITADFGKAGAVSMTVGRDIRVYDFGGWMDGCDAGFSVTSLSRPAYEGVLRARVSALPNVKLQGECPIRRLAVADGRCTGVELEDGSTVAADLVVDSTGLTAPLLKQLVNDGHAEFPTEEIRINVAYTTGRFRRPAAYAGDETGIFILPAPPENHFGLLLPIEDGQWILSLGRRGGEAPPRDPAAFKDYAKGLVAPEVHERIRDAEPVGDLRTFRKPTATRHLLWEAAKWPEGLVVIGDAMSSVNPTYGQGMTVAACEAEALDAMLAERTAKAVGLTGLAADYFRAAADISGRAWSLSINSDYVYPQTEGERPANFAMSRAVAATLRKLADEDEEIRILRYKLVHMIASADALREGDVGIRFFTALQGSMAS